MSEPTNPTPQDTPSPDKPKKPEIIPDLEAMRHHGLTMKQERFAQAYIAENGNATEAARVAGYSDPESSPNAIRVQGHTALANVNVRDRIRELMHQNGVDLGKALENIGRGLSDDDRAHKRWATDRTLELHEARGAQASGSTTNIGIFGLNPEQFDVLCQKVLENSAPRHNKSSVAPESDGQKGN